MEGTSEIAIVCCSEVLRTGACTVYYLQPIGTIKPPDYGLMSSTRAHPRGCAGAPCSMAVDGVMYWSQMTV